MDTRFPRRRWLQVTAGLGLCTSLRPLEAREVQERGRERPKSLIVLWMAGGPSQLETWDPHPGTEIGGPTQAISTSIRDVQIAAGFPQLAAELAALSVIRSLTSKEGDHERGTYNLRTGYRPDPTTIHPSLGAILAHELPDKRLEIPAYVSLGEADFPGRGGYLGDQFDPYRVAAPGESGNNLRSPVETTRQQRRLETLSSLTQSFRTGRSQRVDSTMHQHTVDAALRMMSSEQLKAFELDSETQATRAAYGDSQFGRGCLVARRLIETGVRAVEVTQGGFDTHADNFTGHTLRAGILDPAIATLIRELRERDLLQSTAILVVGEFGRTPKINPLDGRDHWPNGFSCLVGGAGLASGQLIGATDPTGTRKDPTDPVTVPDLFATLLATLGVDFSKELVTPIGRPLKLSEGQPLARLLPDRA